MSSARHDEASTDTAGPPDLPALPPPVAAPQVEAGGYPPLLHRSFLAALLIGALALVLGLLLESPSGQVSAFDRWVYPTLAASFFATALLLIVRRRLLGPLVNLSSIAMIVFLLSKLCFLLYFAPAEMDVQAELTETFFWTPVVYLLAYLTPLVRVGRVGALVFTGLTLALSLGYALPNALAGRSWDVVYALSQMSMASIVLLALTFAFVRFRVDYATARLEAATAQRLAYSDLLTGLPNRRYLQVTLSEAIASARRDRQRLGVLLVDIDGFKVINDTLGHAAGDALLKVVAKRIQAHTRRGDGVVRLTGDEFVVTVPGLERGRQPDVVADKLREMLSEPFSLAGQKLSVTVSIGISVFPDDAEDGATLLRHADSAMARVKRSGKNGVEFYRGKVDAPAERRRDLEKDLRDSYGDRLILFYQPIYDLSTGGMEKVEALLRWNHPLLGTVSPVDFIPIAEESGLIVPIGRWVLDEACHQLQALQAAGLPKVKVAVNVSPLQFIQSDFVATVSRALETSGLPPAGLELEVTESLLMHDLEAVTRTLQRLRALGVGLALDDFGTGYSSLSYLRDLPITTVKIDRSFVRDLDGDHPRHFSRALIQSVIQLASSLDLEVVAEGVESQEQSDLLKAMGCQQGQGYYFAKPMALSDLFLLNAATRRRKRSEDGLRMN